MEQKTVHGKKSSSKGTSKLAPDREFKELLMRTNPAIEEHIVKATKFASQHHRNYAKEIA